MFSPNARCVAASLLTVLTVVSLAGCSRIVGLSDDLARMGAAVIRDTEEMHPNASPPLSDLKANFQKYVTSQEWADAKAAITDTVKLSRKNPICGTTIDSVFDQEPETTASLLSKVAENTAGMNGSYSLHQDAQTLSAYFSSTRPTEKQKAAFAIEVAAFKDAYCE